MKKFALSFFLVCNALAVAQLEVTSLDVSAQTAQNDSAWWKYLLKHKPQEDSSSKETSKPIVKAAQNQPFANSAWTDPDKGFTINFNNAPAAEVVRFISKITKINFIFDEEQLNFNITMVSEGPASIASILSNFIQVLRIHDLMISEEENNVLIHANENVNSPAQVITSENEEIPFQETSLVTRIFTIKNTQPSEILDLIRPMISKNALAEASNNTKHLIVTDTPVVMSQLQKIISILDTPTEASEIAIYKVQNFFASSLVEILDQILDKLGQKDNVLLIPQQNKETIIVVSSPIMTQKTLQILKKLDTPSQSKIAGAPVQKKALNHDNVFLYVPQNRSTESILYALNTIVDNLESSQHESSQITEVIQSAKYLPEIGSILFIGDPAQIAGLKQILAKVDHDVKHSQPGALSIFTFDPQYLSVEQLQVALEKISSNLKEISPPNEALIEIIESMQTIDGTASVMFVGEKIAVDQLQEFLKTIDIDQTQVPAIKQPNPNFLVHELSFLSFKDIQNSVEELIDTIQRSQHPDLSLLDALKSIKYSEDSHSITATADPRVLAHVKELFESWDTQEQLNRIHKQFFMFKPKHRKPSELVASLKQVGLTLRQARLADSALIATVQSAKLIEESQSIIFTGEEKTFKQVESLLTTIDTPLEEFSQLSSMGSGAFLIYNIQNASEKSLVTALHRIADKLDNTSTPNLDLVEALENPIYIEHSHSLMFTGDKATLRELNEIVSKLDLIEEGNTPTQFVFYIPEFVKADKIIEQLHEYAHELNLTGLNDPTLIHTLRTALYSKKTGAILLTGNETSLGRAEKIIKSVDTPSGSVGQQLFIYKPKFMSPAKLIFSLRESAKQIGAKDSSLNKMLKHAHIIGNSISFKGSETSIHRVQEIIETLDTQDEQTNPEQIFIYRPEYISSSNLENALKEIAKTYSKDPSAQDLVHMLDSSYIEKNSNAFVFQGSQSSIDELKKLLKELDVSASQQDSVFVYTLEHANIKEAQTYLETVRDNLKKSEFPDDQLIAIIKTEKPIPQSNSLMFTGKAVAIEKLKTILEKFDSADNAASPKRSKSAFLMYTPKYQNGEVLQEHLLNTARELKSSKLANPYLLSTLEDVHYNAKSNTLLFTGNEHSLEKVKDLLAHFDVPLQMSPSAAAKSNYLIYHPKYVSIESLQNWLTSTTENLKHSGLEDRGLFDALRSMKYSESTKSLTFSGDSRSLQKLDHLIKSYDIPSNASQIEKPNVPLDNITFLVHKLQYHQGDEIIEALQTIGRDLKKYEHSDKNNDLIEAISSIQWLKITNSLLCTGTPPILQRIKGLIRSLDIPLEQIFLDVLLLRTTVNDSLNFGLRWGGAGKILDKVSTSVGLFPTSNQALNSGLNGFGGAIQNSESGSLPPASTFGTGAFDLGIIGDLIIHKGKTFLSLGSLASALQQDTNASLIFNPKLIAQDNQPAHIFSGQNRPFQLETFTQAPTSGGTAQTATNEYRDIGFDLKITPIIGSDDVITLIIQQQFTESISQDLQSTTSNVVNKQTTTTRVHVPNNHFVALSGALRDQRQRTKVGIPCLGGLPVLGAAFSDTSRTNDKSNIIIFIRPQIVTTDQQMIDMTERQEDQFREAAGALEIQYDIDDAIDLITPIDELE